MKLLRIKQVIETTGLARATVYLAASRGTFPKPVKIGARASAWVASEVEEWAKARVAESRGGRHASRFDTRRAA